MLNILSGSLLGCPFLEDPVPTLEEHAEELRSVLLNCPNVQETVASVRQDQVSRSVSLFKQSTTAYSNVYGKDFCEDSMVIRHLWLNLGGLFSSSERNEKVLQLINAGMAEFGVEFIFNTVTSNTYLSKRRVKESVLKLEVRSLEILNEERSY